MQRDISPEHTSYRINKYMKEESKNGLSNDSVTNSNDTEISKATEKINHLLWDTHYVRCVTGTTAAKWMYYVSMINSETSTLRVGYVNCEQWKFAGTGGNMAADPEWIDYELEQELCDELLDVSDPLQEVLKDKSIMGDDGQYYAEELLYLAQSRAEHWSLLNIEPESVIHILMVNELVESQHQYPEDQKEWFKRSEAAA